jgi:hypothetical protein
VKEAGSWRAVLHRPRRLRPGSSWLAAVLLLGVSASAHAQTDDVLGFGAAEKKQREAAALLPGPAVYMSSAWSFWPHAWASVPSLWSTWYRDVLPPPSPPAEGLAAAAAAAATTDSGTASPAPAAPEVKKLLAGEDNQVLPPPRLVRKRRYNLVISGAGLLVGVWAADRLLSQDASGSAWPWVPIIGPWYQFSQQNNIASPSTQTLFFLAADGVLQATGLTLAILGFVLTTKHYVVTVKPRSDPAAQKSP